MKFLQDLMIAIFLPRKTTRSVHFQLSEAQQNRVVRQCEEINSMIQEVHTNLSHIRQAGSTTSRLARETHAKHVRGRNSLRRQQEECERINGELKKISDNMRAVRENVALASRKSFLTVNRSRELEKTVASISAPVMPCAAETCSADSVKALEPAAANVVSLTGYKSS